MSSAPSGNIFWSIRKDSGFIRRRSGGRVSLPLNPGPFPGAPGAARADPTGPGDPPEPGRGFDQGRLTILPPPPATRHPPLTLTLLRRGVCMGCVYVCGCRAGRRQVNRDSRTVSHSNAAVHPASHSDPVTNQGRSHRCPSAPPPSSVCPPGSAPPPPPPRDGGGPPDGAAAGARGHRRRRRRRHPHGQGRPPRHGGRRWMATLRLESLELLEGVVVCLTALPRIPPVFSIVFRSHKNQTPQENLKPIFTHKWGT